MVYVFTDSKWKPFFEPKPFHYIAQLVPFITKLKGLSQSLTNMLPLRLWQDMAFSLFHPHFGQSMVDTTTCIWSMMDVIWICPLNYSKIPHCIVLGIINNVFCRTLSPLTVPNYSGDANHFPFVIFQAM